MSRRAGSLRACVGHLYHTPLSQPYPPAFPSASQPTGTCQVLRPHCTQGGPVFLLLLLLSGAPCACAGGPRALRCVPGPMATRSLCRGPALRRPVPMPLLAFPGWRAGWGWGPQGRGQAAPPPAGRGAGRSPASVLGLRSAPESPNRQGSTTPMGKEDAGCQLHRA